jgi:CheY-like chemotaxis protein
VVKISSLQFLIPNLAWFYGLIILMENTPDICLLHWNEAEAQECLAWLAETGFSAYHLKEAGPLMLKQLRAQSPAAFVIDLSRLPSHGREVAAALRANKKTCHIPIIFVGGQPEKVERVRTLLPDAVFTTWEAIGPAIQEAIDHPPVQPVMMQSSMDAYAGQPLLKKLGIKSGMTVGLLDAPQDFPQTLGSLPDGARLSYNIVGALDMLIWFVREPAALEQGIHTNTIYDLRLLWIAWAKKSSILHSGLTESLVRKAGLSNGWVDYKICSIDADWSGLLFTRRK